MQTDVEARVKTLMTEAGQLSQRGQGDAAATRLQQVLALAPDFPPALSQLGAYALARGDTSWASELLQRAVKLAPEFTMAHANLSRVHAARGDLKGALAAINDAIKADPTAWGAHMEKARLLEAQGRHRDAANAWGTGLAYLPTGSAQAPELQPLISRAQQAVHAHQAELHDFLRSHLREHLAEGNPRQLERFEHCLDIATGRREFVTARPLMLAFPRLPAIPYFHRDDFDWAPKVEAAFPEILRELQQLLDQQREFVPYVQTPAGSPKGQFAPLDRSLDWGAYFLWKNGQRIDTHADLCPVTESTLLTHAPLNTIPQRAPVMFFSALKPGTHIAPHNGATNTRLTVHLPLIIPPDCGLRVGGETHVWKPGELVLFDDTIRHEAWNNSDQLRVVLIFDVWHPMLTPLERELVAHTIEGIMAFNGEGADLGEL